MVSAYVDTAPLALDQYALGADHFAGGAITMVVPHGVDQRAARNCPGHPVGCQPIAGEIDQKMRS